MRRLSGIRSQESGGRGQGAGVGCQLSVVSCQLRKIRSDCLLSRGATHHTQPSTLNCQPSTFNPRSAFTLIEVLVALALSVILLAAVYGAINLSFRLTTAGREQMEQAQIVRALFQQFDADVRSVVFAVQEDVAGDSDEAAAEEDTDVETEIMSTDEAFTSASNGVNGDSQNIVLHVSRPSRLSRYETTNSDAESGRSDLASVSYFLAVRGASGLPGTVAQMAYQGSLLNAPRRGTVSGLTRLEGDRMTITFAEQTGDVETLAASAQILAPEVVSLSFAYWDGVEWTETWDTVSSERLPAAIEITLGVDTTEKDPDGTGDGSLSDRIRTTSTVNDVEPTYYRHVVALPLSEPYVGELSE